MSYSAAMIDGFGKVQPHEVHVSSKQIFPRILLLYADIS